MRYISHSSKLGFTYQAIHNIPSKNEAPEDSHSCPSRKRALQLLGPGLFKLASNGRNNECQKFKTKLSNFMFQCFKKDGY